jgi:hypothetical protein
VGWCWCLGFEAFVSAVGSGRRAWCGCVPVVDTGLCDMSGLRVMWEVAVVWVSNRYVPGRSSVWNCFFFGNPVCDLHPLAVDTFRDLVRCWPVWFCCCSRPHPRDLP